MIKHIPTAARIALLTERVTAHDAHAYALFQIAAEASAELGETRKSVEAQRTIVASAERATEWSGNKKKIRDREILEGDKLMKLYAALDAVTIRARAATEDWLAAEKIAKAAAQDLADAKKA